MGKQKDRQTLAMFDPITGEVFTDNDTLNIDPELVENLNLDEIDKEALNDAMILCKDLASVYFNEQYMNEHAELKKRIDHELESLRILYKLRKSDERIHDINLNAITNHPENASLYRALSQTQASLLSIQRQIDDTVKSIDNILKAAQIEQNTIDEEEVDEKPSRLHRGTKSFIEEMKIKQGI